MKTGKPPAVDLSAASAALASDLCRRLPDLAHIDPQRLLFCLARSRAEGRHGVYARIAPLRFAGGAAEHQRRRGRFLETFRLPSLAHEGREILYLVHLFVPRFLRLDSTQKLNTIVHELFHVSEDCNGDIRRFPGRNFAHGGSRRSFERTVGRLAAAYLESGPDPALLAFLNLEEAGWLRRDFRLTGLCVPVPRARLVARQRF